MLLTYAIPTFYSKTSGDAATLANWTTAPDGTGANPLSFLAGGVFIIQTGHDMTTSTAWTLGQDNTVHIENGGKLTATYIVTAANFRVDDGGMYVHNSASGTPNGATSDFPGSMTRTFGASSGVEIQKWANGGMAPAALPTPTGGWGNLTINVASLNGSWQQNGGLTIVKRNLTIRATGGGSRIFQVTDSTVYTLAIGGDLVISGGILDLVSGSINAGTIINLGGNFNQTGGSFRNSSASGAVTFQFTGGVAEVDWTLGGTLGDMQRTDITIAAGKTVNLKNSLYAGSSTSRTLTVNGTLNCGVNVISGNAKFTLAPGATLGIGSTAGIAANASSGNVQVTSARSYNTNASYVYCGTAGQVTGDGLPSAITNLTINNSAGVSLSGDTSIRGSGALNLTAGLLNLNGKSLTLASGGTICVDMGSLSGAPTLGGTVNVSYTGTTPVNTGNEIPSNTGALNNLTVSKTGGVTMAADATVNGVLTINSGAGLDLNGHTVTVTGAPILNGELEMEVNKTGPSTFTGSKLIQTAGTLTIGGTLTVTSVGAALTGGEVFDLFDAPAFNTSSSFDLLNLPSPLASGLNWYTGNLVTGGTIIVNRAPRAQDIAMGAQSGVKQTLQIINSPKYAPTDPDGDSLNLSTVNYISGLGATVQINGDSVEYTAPSTYTGPDSFSYTVSDDWDGMAVATVTVTVSSGVPQQTASITFDGSSATVTFWGIPGTLYTIERSTDLSEWTEVGTATANDTSHQPYGQINFTDDDPPQGESGYYRLKP